MDSYLKSEEERFVRIFSIEQPADTADLGGGIKPLYRVIKFFKLLEDRIRELRNECGDISSHKM